MATNAEIQSEVEGQTIPQAFVRTVEACADDVAVRWRNDDHTWGEWTFAEYAQRVAAAAAGLAAKGVGRGTRVVLMLRNIAEFHV
ncbi:MAG: AMP-binding protein, partial [Acidimicrobiales bacterium]